jgi:tRNA threonylcarbamoyl adenosine modification protein YeaZ
VLVLVLDTSTPAVTAALLRVESAVALLAERVTVDARAHAELLAPAIVDVLAEVGAVPRDLSAVVAGLGPGPFTGLRIGLVTAAAIGQALAIPVYGVCSLDGIGALTAGTTVVATDARRREIYWALYQDGVRRSDPAVNRPADLSALLADLDLDFDPDVERPGCGPGELAAVGDGAQLYAAVLGLPVSPWPRYPSALALAEAAVDRIRAGAPGDPLHPLYLRRPDAAEPRAPKLVNQ